MRGTNGAGSFKRISSNESSGPTTRADLEKCSSNGRAGRKRPLPAATASEHDSSELETDAPRLVESGEPPVGNQTRHCAINVRGDDALLLPAGQHRPAGFGTGLFGPAI